MPRPVKAAWFNWRIAARRSSILSDAQPGQDCFENRGGGLHRDDAPVMTVYDGLDGVHVETNWFRDERLVPQC
jgi:hypothetical protein